MFGFLQKNKKKQEKFSQVNFKLSGLHCSSCTILIDNTLEEVEGVQRSQSSYALSRAVVHYDPELVSVQELEEIIRKTGYRAEEIKAE